MPVISMFFPLQFPSFAALWLTQPGSFCQLISASMETHFCWNNWAYLVGIFCRGHMVLVFCFGGKESLSISYPNVFLWPPHPHVVCLVITIHDDGTLEPPPCAALRVWDCTLMTELMSHSLVLLLLPVLGQIDSRLWACHTKLVQRSVAWDFTVVAISKGHSGLDVVPLLGYPYEFPVAVLYYPQPEFKPQCVKTLTGTVSG